MKLRVTVDCEEEAGYLGSSRAERYGNDDVKEVRAEALIPHVFGSWN